MRHYLDRAIKVLQRFGLSTTGDSGDELIQLLESVKHVDEARALAIADVIKHMSTFNRLVRENVENIRIGNRYLEISQMFDSVREDSKMLISQLADGQISRTERFQNWWMKIRRGTPSDRFETIADTYKDVSKDTRDQLDREDAIMDARLHVCTRWRWPEALWCLWLNGRDGQENCIEFSKRPRPLRHHSRGDGNRLHKDSLRRRPPRPRHRHGPTHRRFVWQNIQWLL